jgi:hypothetical protein
MQTITDLDRLLMVGEDISAVGQAIILMIAPGSLLTGPHTESWRQSIIDFGSS